MGNSALPDHLKGKLHNDYIFPFCYIPRSWTSYKLFQPPKTLLKYNCTSKTYYEGKQGINPIQNKLNGKFCSFHFNFPLFFSISFKWGWYFMIGCRWDACDFYYSVPAMDISYAERFEK